MKGILSLAITSFVYILFAHNTETFKGIKMCHKDCGQTTQCTDILYDPVHLECRLLFDSKKVADSTPFAVRQRIEKTSTVNNVLKICSAHGRLIRTKLGKGVCIQSGAKKVHPEYSRLLLVYTKTFQVDLKTRDVREFHFPWKHILCVAYLNEAKMFIISQETELFSTPINSMKKATLRKDIHVLDIDTDEAENVIIIRIYTKSNTFDICSIELNGSNLKCFVSSVRSDLFFAVDTNHKQVYVFKRRQIASYAYTGTLTRDSVCLVIYMNAMTHDPVEDILVYDQLSRLYIVTKAGNSRRLTTIKKFGYRIVTSMKIQNPYLYIMTSKGKLFVINVANLSEVNVINIPDRGNGSGMCFF